MRAACGFCKPIGFQHLLHRGKGALILVVVSTPKNVWIGCPGMDFFSGTSSPNFMLLSCKYENYKCIRGNLCFKHAKAYHHQLKDLLQSRPFSELTFWFWFQVTGNSIITMITSCDAQSSEVTIGGISIISWKKTKWNGPNAAGLHYYTDSSLPKFIVCFWSDIMRYLSNSEPQEDRAICAKIFAIQVWCGDMNRLFLNLGVLSCNMPYLYLNLPGCWLWRDTSDVWTLEPCNNCASKKRAWWP